MPGAILPPWAVIPGYAGHLRASDWLTALARAISKMGPGDGSLQLEQRVCKIIGHVTELAGRDLHPLGGHCLTTAHTKPSLPSPSLCRSGLGNRRRERPAD